MDGKKYALIGEILLSSFSRQWSSRPTGVNTGTSNLLALRRVTVDGDTLAEHGGDELGQVEGSKDSQTEQGEGSGAIIRVQQVSGAVSQTRLHDGHGWTTKYGHLDVILRTKERNGKKKGQQIHPSKELDDAIIE